MPELKHYWYMDVPRLLAAGGTGVTTALLGGVVPVIGLAGGLIMGYVEKDVPTLKRIQYPVEGVVDGSAALVAKALFGG